MNEQERERESREALERVRRDTESVGSSALARMSRQAQDHFAARDAVGQAGETDPIELWGRRIGRGLSLVGVVVLGLWLLVQLGIL